MEMGEVQYPSPRTVNIKRYPRLLGVGVSG